MATAAGDWSTSPAPCSSAGMGGEVCVCQRNSENACLVQPTAPAVSCLRNLEFGAALAISRQSRPCDLPPSVMATDGAGPTLATAGGEDVYVWHLGKPGAQLDALAPSACLPPLAGGVTALSWTSLSNALAAASSRGTISLFSQGGAPLETMTSKDVSGDGERIKCISFASHSLSLCSGGSSTELRIWDCKRKEVVRTYRGHSAAISACAYGDKDMLLASGSSAGDVLVHTTASPSASSEPQRIKTGGAGGSARAVRALKFSPFRRSHVAAAGEEAVVELYDTARSDSPSLVKFTQHTGTVTGLAFSPVNELLLCSAGLDCRALFYDVQAKKLVKSVTCEAP